MTPRDVVEACWNYATSATEIERDQIAQRIADHYHADSDQVAAVLTRHLRRIATIYDEAHQRPSLGSLELADEQVANELGRLEVMA